MSNLDRFSSCEQTSRCPNCGTEAASNCQGCNHCGSPIGQQSSLGCPPPSQDSCGNQTAYPCADLQNPYASPQIDPIASLPPIITASRQEMVKRIKRSWFFYSLFWRIALMTILLILTAGILIAIEVIPPASKEVGNSLSVVLFLLGVVAAINGLVLLYRLWAVVPRSMAATTPGRAVGFLFIPVICIYWAFIAYYKLAQHYHDLSIVSGRDKGHEVLAIIRAVVHLIPYYGLFLGALPNFLLLSRLKEDALYILEHYPDESQVADMPDSMITPYPNDNTQYNQLVPVHTSGLAIFAGYLGLCSVLLFPAPFAILFGWLALKRLNKHPGMHGYGRAWFGIIAGGLVLFSFAAYVAIMIAMELINK